ncbi:serine/threonine protein kinase [Gracilaria domingensis]|nr:serine/threonine protein kinase [Gracilaria domingensis]
MPSYPMQTQREIKQCWSDVFVYKNHLVTLKEEAVEWHTGRSGGREEPLNGGDSPLANASGPNVSEVGEYPFAIESVIEASYSPVPTIMKVVEKADLFVHEGGDLRFEKTTVVCEDADGYFITSMKRRSRAIRDHIPKSEGMDGVGLSPQSIYPSADDLPLSKAQCSLSPACYVKQPSILSAHANVNAVKELLLREARIMEALKDYNHPNIVRYHGYIERKGELRGFCLERYPESLPSRLDRLGACFDVDHTMEGIKRGIEFLHDVGYAHNDINPANIMFRDDGTPVIIDFDACVPIGEELGEKVGTPFFCDESATHSREQN